MPRFHFMVVSAVPILVSILMSGCALTPPTAFDQYRAEADKIAKMTPTQREQYRLQKVAEIKTQAEQGDVISQYSMGNFYYEEKEYASAHFWFLKAAEQSDSLAQNGALLNVARDYSEGKGVPRDDVKAAFWLQKGADQGISDAQVKLADMYAKGRGVPRNKAKQLTLLQSAARHRNKEAIKILTALGDPGGVLQQIASEDERNRQNTARAVNEANARRAWEQQQQQQPQRWCTQTGGGAVGLFPC